VGWEVSACEAAASGVGLAEQLLTIVLQTAMHCL
jgi:hypothetical protein